MIRPALETRQVTTPSGVVVTLKNHQTYGDAKAIQLAVLGDMIVESEPGSDGATPPKPKITLAQASEMVMVTLERMITAWNVEEENGEATPLTRAMIDEVFTEADVDYLMNQIKPTDDEAKKKSAISS